MNVFRVFVFVIRNIFKYNEFLIYAFVLYMDEKIKTWIRIRALPKGGG